MTFFKFVELFQLLGSVLLVIAIWSKTEKGNLMDFNSMAVDPATILLIVGAVMFWIGFFGWVGALRENVKFLQVVSFCLVVNTFHCRNIIPVQSTRPNTIHFS